MAIKSIVLFFLIYKIKKYIADNNKSKNNESGYGKRLKLNKEG